MDRALSITWYDMPAASRDAYLKWLHGGFMAKLTRRPGVLWAAHYEVKKYDIPPRVRQVRELTRQLTLKPYEAAAKVAKQALATGSTIAADATAILENGVIDRNTIGSATDATQGNRGGGVVVTAGVQTTLWFVK